jgi:hypothetical protein
LNAARFALCEKKKPLPLGRRLFLLGNGGALPPGDLGIFYTGKQWDEDGLKKFLHI